jgi:hypothetical protein
MSDEYRLTVLLERNGKQLPNFPLIRRLVINEDADILQQAQPDSNTTTFHPIPAAVMQTMQIFLLTTDQPINLDINQLSAVPLNGRGLILIWGTALTQATPSDNITFNNPSSATVANLSGTVAGS